MNESELIERLQQREEAAFRQLVEGWKDRIYNTALGLLQQAEDAEDITQEVFVTAWRSLDGYRSEAGLTTWLYRIAVNKSLDLLRSRKRKKRFAFVRSIWGQDGSLESDAPDFHHPGVQLEKKQEAARLFRAIRQLPDSQQVAFSLQKLEGLTIAEIALVMEMSASAVESLLHRGKANLRKILTTHHEENKGT